MMEDHHKEALRHGIVVALRVIGFVATFAIAMIIAMLTVGAWLGPLIAVILWKPGSGS